MNLVGDLRRMILLSTLVHIGLIGLFQIQIGSGAHFSSYSFCQISFLGSLLDEGIHQAIPGEAIKTRAPTREWIPGELIRPLANFTERVQPAEVPVDLPPLIHPLYPSRPKPLILGPSQPPMVELEGDIRGRGILYQPRLFTFPSGIAQQLNEFEVALRFQVSKEGLVQQVEQAQSSGYPEVDALVMRYLRNWRFVPQDLKSQSGILRVHLRRS